MGLKTGYLDKNGHPNVRIKIWGMAEQFAQEFEAMIDTGFTGFLSMPLTAAFPLAITLFGTTSYTLADGSISPKLLGYGTVELEGEKAAGSIVLEPNSSAACNLWNHPWPRKAEKVAGTRIARHIGICTTRRGKNSLEYAKNWNARRRNWKN